MRLAKTHEHICCTYTSNAWASLRWNRGRTLCMLACSLTGVRNGARSLLQLNMQCIGLCRDSHHIHGSGHCLRLLTVRKVRV